MFLQSMHTPQKVIETLERMGISVSVNAIHASLLATYAYDNFDVDLKTHEHKIENSTEYLKHLTSGLMFPLQHNISKEDLRCSEELWKMSPFNTRAELPPKKGWVDLLVLHVNTPDDAIEAIPITKMPIIATSAMDISNSTVIGNIQSIVNLLEQGRIRGPAVVDDPDMPDISEYVVLFHGDLGTGERLQSAQQRQSIENTLWNRLQHVIFIPGLFHLKMAATDTIWRIFLQPNAAQLDETSLMRDIGILRPKETGHYGSKPGFRHMHELIMHDGICRRLDCWRVEVQAGKHDPKWTSLEEFAASKPTLKDIEAIARTLARDYVAGHQLQRMRCIPAAQRDVQYENGLLLNRYVLIYEELSYAMNTGDIRWVETCLVTWIPMFKATGKHKYANIMTDFLCKVHFVYPEGLKRAVRYDIMVNPTGKKGKFRGVDWCVELNNLFTKVINGGKGSNHTVPRIIMESPLIQIYRNLHTMFQNDFLHTHKTTQHGEANMSKTFQILCGHMSKHSVNEVVNGRGSHHSIPDILAKGQELMEKSSMDNKDGEQEAAVGEGEDECPSVDDVAVELVW
ncbi:hypothetical protein EV702DRAFT_1178476 [Suillus placidus]|uniref:DUF6589 domain-containing protein n=1 Tax=Suillus placidus TaxID=48579 RepID=A0A9P7D503_9AGAM|nr:hypothetical protein EV702DRAFT_1178476 [Suillus placidus]